MPRKGKALLLLGVVTAAAYLALAPRSPLVGTLIAPQTAAELAIVLALASMALLFTGYSMHQLETRPRALAFYNIAHLTVLTLWMLVAITLQDLVLHSHSLASMLKSLLLASPVLAVSYPLLRRLHRRALDLRVHVIVVGIEDERENKNNH